MKRIGLLLTAVLALGLWFGVGTAAAGGGLPLLGGGQENGSQDNGLVVVQNVASGNTIQGIGNQAGSNGAVAAAGVDQSNVDQQNGDDQNGRDPGKPGGCGCDGTGGVPETPAPAVNPAPGPAPDGQSQDNGAIVVQNVASGNTIQGVGNEAGSNGAVAVTDVDQSNVQGSPADGKRCPCGGSDPSPKQQDGQAGPSQDGQSQDNGAIVVQNVASGNTIQGVGNEAGSNGAVAVAAVDQQNVAGSHGDARPGKDDVKDGGDQSNHVVVVQNVASGNTVQGIGNEAGSNGAVAVTSVDQKNVDGSRPAPQGAPSDGQQGCGSCQPKPEPKPCPKPQPKPCPKPKPEPKPCPKPEPAPCPKPKPAPCPEPKPAPCPPPKPEPCPEPKPAPCPPPKAEPCPPPKPCPKPEPCPEGTKGEGLVGGLLHTI